MTEAAKIDGAAAGSIDAYVRFFETLTPETLDALRGHVTPDVRFKDPFNDVTGIDAMTAIFNDMFEKVDEPAFRVTHRAQSAEDDTVWFLRWRLTGRLPALSGGDWDVAGMSEIHLAPDGRVAAHIDHWDAGRNFYERLPVIGPIIRLLRQRAGQN